MYIPPRVHILKLFADYPQYMFFLLRRKLRFFLRYRWVARKGVRDDRVGPPLVYKLYLTMRCNLRCGMCMFWGESGVLKQGPQGSSSQELDMGVLERILKESRGRHPSFILSGGEPLLHSRFAEIAALLKKYRCFAYVCTNGMELHRHMASLSGNPYLIYYISLDGPRQINDHLRGAGVYDRVTQNIRAIKSLKKKPYIGIQVTVQKDNIPYLYETCREAVSLGADWVLLNLQWFLTPGQAAAYEGLLKKEYQVDATSHRGFVGQYDIDKEEFVRQCRKIRGQRWPIQISSYLKQPQDIYSYVDSSGANLYSDACYKEWVRMDVLPDGSVTPCIQYPDLTFGSLREHSVMELWNSAEFARFRVSIRKRLLPVCGKCHCFYLYDAGRMVL